VARRTIAEVGEFAFLSRLLSGWRKGAQTVIGPGQDCAVIRCGTRNCLLTVDALVEGVHFERAWLTPRQLGRRAMLVNASDIAAMGGRPRFCVVNLEVPPTYAMRDLWALQSGIVAAARQCGADVVGGNLTRAHTLAVSVSVLAEAPARIVARRGAHLGDRIYVTGTLGDAALGVRLLRARGAGSNTRPLRRFREPAPRLRAGRLLVESGIVSAMIDVSDGLVQDLGHLCRESAVGALIHAERVPLSTTYRVLLGAGDLLALHGGEDYELLCTVPERKVKVLERNRARLGCSITCIGEIAGHRGVRLVDAAGRRVALPRAGYDHFRGPV
jgi:thiamine-monophosphate kinase